MTSEFRKLRNQWKCYYYYYYYLEEDKVNGTEKQKISTFIYG
jgi:hypothetical protein